MIEESSSEESVINETELEVSEELQNESPETSAKDLEEVEPEIELSTEEQLEVDVLKWKDQAIRTAAELDNYRKRVARDLQEARKYGNRGFLEELLPVLDNFKMGLEAAADDESSMIYLGMKMVKDQLDEFLSNNGVKVMDPTGQNFDHHLHEAISQEETEEYKEGTIIRTARPGYTLHDKLLRAANVVVAQSPNNTDFSEESQTENAK